MFYTATAKIVYNNKFNTFRVLVAFNTNKVTINNAVYISGDLPNTQDYSIQSTILTAKRRLSIKQITVQITQKALSNLSDLQMLYITSV
jgi:hypothetical protein